MATRKSSRLGGASNPDVNANEYEKVRVSRIKENASKLESLGLKEGATLFKSQVERRPKVIKKKLARVRSEDGGYNPNEIEDMGGNGNNNDDELSEPDNVVVIHKGVFKVNLGDDEVGGNVSERSHSLRTKKYHLRSKNPRAMAVAKAFKRSQERAAKQVGGLSYDSTALVTSYGNISPTREGNEVEKAAEKNKRGPTRCSEVYARTEDDRVEIILNDEGQPIGPSDEVLSEFINFLGTVARKVNILPLIVKSWKTFDEEKRDELWEYVKKYFIVDINGKKWVLTTINDCWRCYKSRLRKDHFHKYETDEMRMKNRPNDVPKPQFRERLKIWASEEAQ